MLHPDLHTDPESRLIAECQTKRLNALRAVLTKPAARAAYDRSLAAVRVPDRLLILPPQIRGRRKGWTALPWAAAAVIVVAVLGPSAVPRAANLPESTPAQQQLPQPSHPMASRTPVKGHNSARATRPEISVVEPVRLDPVAVPLRALNGPLREIVVPAKPATAAPAISPKPASIAGQWFSIPRSGERIRVQGYASEYVHVSIAEENDGLSGTFEARYRVPDRPISPSVRFRFLGTYKESSELVWNGPGGAAGKLTLRLLDPQHMELTWWVTEVGTELGLGSGRATLIRLEDR